MQYKYNKNMIQKQTDYWSSKPIKRSLVQRGGRSAGAVTMNHCKLGETDKQKLHIDGIYGNLNIAMHWLAQVHFE